MRIVMIAAAAALFAGPALAQTPPAEAPATHAGHDMKAKPVPADCPAPADHAINTKGTGATNGKAMTAKEKACDEARMANNKHPDLMK